MSVCSTALPPKPTAGEHARHLTAACLGGLWCKLYFSLVFLFPVSFFFFYSKHKIVPNSLLLEGGNLRLLAEHCKPQIWKSCCGEVVFYGRAPRVSTAGETKSNHFNASRGKIQLRRGSTWISTVEMMKYLSNIVNSDILHAAPAHRL